MEFGHHVIACHIQRNDVVALCGPVGVGKTTLAKGIISGLGIGAPVRSQTFTIIKTYEGAVPVHHIDLYRVRDIDMIELGIDELLSVDAIMLVEWWERATAHLPPITVRIDIALHTRGARVICIRNPNGVQR